MACQSECLSEHYIRAKQFAALRSKKKKGERSKKRQHEADFDLTAQSELMDANQRPSPNRTDISSLYISPAENESLRMTSTHDAHNLNEHNYSAFKYGAQDKGKIAKKTFSLKQAISDLAL